MARSRPMTRRSFLSRAGAAAAFPLVRVPAPGRPGPNDRIAFGIIACGSRGRANMGAFLGRDDCRVLAVCDVDEGRAAQFKEQIEKKYKDDGAYKGCAVYKDFRELCARKDIDAVTVSTADHWHYLTAREAVVNGKDVYCEKPVTHHWLEGKLLVEQVAKHKRIWQTGSQQRSAWNFRRSVEIVLNGLIGKVQTVEVGLPRGRGGHKPGQEKVEEPPPGLDYDFWCGPSKKLPFIKARLHWDWRWNLNYGGGQLMDWIGHHNDIAHWGLGEDVGGPVEIEAVDFRYPEDTTVYDAPYDYTVKCAYASGATSTISSRNTMGTRWTGDKGWVYVNRGKLDASNKEWIQKDFDPGPVKAYDSPNHHDNFAECVKSRKPCICPLEVSHHSITPGHLGYLSDRLKRKLKWDPRAEKILGDAEADKALNTVEYRPPWKLT